MGVIGIAVWWFWPSTPAASAPVNVERAVSRDAAAKPTPAPSAKTQAERRDLIARRKRRLYLRRLWNGAYRPPVRALEPVAVFLPSHMGGLPMAGHGVLNG